jgi:ribosomal subunit interface protein
LIELFDPYLNEFEFIFTAKTLSWYPTQTKTMEKKMNVDVQTRSFSLTSALRRYVKKRLSNLINTRDDHVRRINVRLSDINGPHGGIDKRCHVHLIVPHLADIVIEETQDNMYSAIDRAVDRAKEVLQRRISRQRDRKRSRLSSFRQAYAMTGT